MPNPAPSRLTPVPAAPEHALWAGLPELPGAWAGPDFPGTRRQRRTIFPVHLRSVLLRHHLGSIEVGENGKKVTVVNVYLPDDGGKNNPWKLPPLLANLYNRPQFIGQFWVGIAAWPAIWQYLRHDPQRTDPILHSFERAPEESDLKHAERKGTKETTNLGWVYTVIAGVLNVMVIYDAFAGPAYAGGNADKRKGANADNANVAIAGQ